MKRWIASFLIVPGLAMSGFACHSEGEKPPPSTGQAAVLPPSHAPLTTPPANTATLPPGVLGEAQGAPPVDYAGAKKEIEATLKAKPKNLDLRMQAAEFYMKAGDYASALPHLRVATSLAPKEALAWIALGDAAALTHQFEEAARAYDRAEKQDARNPQIVRGRGQMFVLQRKWKEAQRVLEAGVARYPEDAEIRTVLGNLYLILNKPRLAAEVIKPALQQQPERADLHYMLGEAYERDLHIEAAIREMQETVRLDPNNAEAWGRIGLYENNLTRYREAREPLQRAISLAPNEPHYYCALGDSYLLEIRDPANFDRAAELYRKALSLNNSNEKALYSFGMALTRRGKPEDLKEAATLFQRLIQLQPDDMNAHYKLAETYRRLGQEKEAAAEQAKFQDLFAKGRHQTRELYASVSFKDTPEAHLKLAQQAANEKNYTLAVREYQLALERNPNLAEAQKGLEQAQQRLSAGKESVR